MPPVPHHHDSHSGTFCPPELVQRISSWRTTVEPRVSAGRDVQSPSPVVPISTRPKNRIQKPYARQGASLRSRISSANVPGSGTAGPTPELTSLREGQVTTSFYDPYRQPTTTFRGAYDLPDPVRNPINTSDPVHFADEYCRIMLLYEQVHQKQNELEQRSLYQPSQETTEHLLDIGASAQRLSRSLQYIVARSREYGYDLDFNTIYFKYCSQLFPAPPPLKATPLQLQNEFIKMPQARQFSEGWKINPL